MIVKTICDLKSEFYGSVWYAGSDVHCASFKVVAEGISYGFCFHFNHVYFILNFVHDY